MKQIRQFRYYKDGDARNLPATLTQNDLVNYNIFSSCGIVYQLGIQAPPGALFYLNQSENNIAVGITGIYELDLENLGIIRSIQFDKKTFINEDISRNIQENGLIIDILYEGA